MHSTTIDGKITLIASLSWASKGIKSKDRTGQELEVNTFAKNIGKKWLNHAALHQGVLFLIHFLGGAHARPRNEVKKKLLPTKGDNSKVIFPTP